MQEMNVFQRQTYQTVDSSGTLFFFALWSSSAREHSNIFASDGSVSIDKGARIWQTSALNSTTSV